MLTTRKVCDLKERGVYSTSSKMYSSLIKNQIIPSNIYKFDERRILLFRRLCEVSIDDRILIEAFNYKVSFYKYRSLESHDTA